MHPILTAIIKVICVGQHPSTKEIGDLDKMYSLGKFIAR
jgi:hypothetical protein